MDEDMVTVSFSQDTWEEMKRYFEEGLYDNDNDVEVWVFDAVRDKIASDKSDND